MRITSDKNSAAGGRMWLTVCIVLAVAFLFFFVHNLAC
jgi:hypothetical protein